MSKPDDKEHLELMEQVFRDEAGREITKDDIEQAVKFLDLLWLHLQEPAGHG